MKILDLRFGILVCGSGIGMSIVANKFPGVRAALCHDELTAEMSRRHNDANVLCLSADLLGVHTHDYATHLLAALDPPPPPVAPGRR